MSKCRGRGQCTTHQRIDNATLHLPKCGEDCLNTLDDHRVPGKSHGENKSDYIGSDVLNVVDDGRRDSELTNGMSESEENRGC